MKKRGFLEISFGMIFSIILIIAFISLAVYVLVFFLNTQKSITVDLFIQDLRQSVTDAWQSTSVSEEKTFSIPEEIEFVCFADFSKQSNNNRNIYDEISLYESADANIFFYPHEKNQGRDYDYIDHINIASITARKNPYCLQNNKGKITLTIEKSFNDALVTIQ